MNHAVKTRNIRQIILAGLSVASIGASLPAFAGSTLAGASTATCPDISAAIQQAANNAYTQAEETYQQVPAPANLSSSTCFSNILDMGTSIGLSFFNPQDLIKQLEQMVCNAAQQALQWPVQQADNAINQYGQLPYGMGGVTASPGGSGVSVNTFTSSGPNVGSIPTGGGNTLSNALGN
jgi:hypothetical protein